MVKFLFHYMWHSAARKEEKEIQLQKKNLNVAANAGNVAARHI